MLADVACSPCNLIDADIKPFDLMQQKLRLRRGDKTRALPGKKRDAHRHFQIPHQAAYGWLRDVHRFRRRRHAVRRHDVAEGFQLAGFQSQGKSPYNILA